MHKTELIYYFKEEAVICEYKNQFISFNCYNMQSRKKFKDFKNVLQESKRKEYNCIGDIYGLAREYGVQASAGHRPTMTDKIAF